jgi:hypothetical protein
LGLCGCQPPSDEAAGELEQGAVVAWFLRPADQEAAEAVEPGVGALDHPAAGAVAGLALEQRLLLAAGADVAAEAEFGEQVVHLGVVVALVQAEGVRAGPRR